MVASMGPLWGIGPGGCGGGRLPELGRVLSSPRPPPIRRLMVGRCTVGLMGGECTHATFCRRDRPRRLSGSGRCWTMRLPSLADAGSRGGGAVQSVAEADDPLLQRGDLRRRAAHEPVELPLHLRVGR
jgi:hypothetical protein